MLKTIITLSMLFAVVLSSGCAVYQAMTTESPKDPAFVKTGVYRGQIVTLFGQPLEVRPMADHRMVEHYEFVDGFPWWANGLRALGWGAADFFTLCVAELVTWPLELTVFDGTPYGLDVVYDQNGRVMESLVMNKNGEVMFKNGQPVVGISSAETEKSLSGDQKDLSVIKL